MAPKSVYCLSLKMKEIAILKQTDVRHFYNIVFTIDYIKSQFLLTFADRAETGVN